MSTEEWFQGAFAVLSEGTSVKIRNAVCALFVTILSGCALRIPDLNHARRGKPIDINGSLEKAQATANRAETKADGASREALEAKRIAVDAMVAAQRAQITADNASKAVTPLTPLLPLAAEKKKEADACAEAKAKADAAAAQARAEEAAIEHDARVKFRLEQLKANPPTPTK